MGLRCLYINHSLDNRSDAPFSTHSALYKDLVLNFDSLQSNDLYKVNIDDYQIIGIDEAQFFNDLSMVVDWVDRLGKHVIVAGLDGDFNRQRFGYLLNLIPFSDSVQKLCAYCKNCAKDGKLRDAIFTRYTGARDSDSTVVVGGAECYTPVCRACYNIVLMDRHLSAGECASAGCGGPHEK